MVSGSGEWTIIFAESNQLFTACVQDYNYVLQNVIRSSLGLS